MSEADFKWSFLVHFGMNMWGDIVFRRQNRNGYIKRHLTDREFAMVGTDEYVMHDRVRFDETLWREISAKLQKVGCNQILIDVGEMLEYPSHPELAVKGSWSPDRLAAEVRRLRGMGFVVVPKLNFSCCHHAWLGEYSRMVSSPKYYEVCSDLIRDTLDVFKGATFLHIGMDEEQMPKYQSYSHLLVMRQGELWWHDILWLVKEVEKHGARAWMWHDYLSRHGIEEFEKRIPKTVVQSPWLYLNSVQEKPSFKVLDMFRRLADAGYDMVPCSSHCYSGENDKGFLLIEKWCRDNLPPIRYKGYLMAPWMQMGTAYRRLLLKGADLIGEAIRAC